MSKEEIEVLLRLDGENRRIVEVLDNCRYAKYGDTTRESDRCSGKLTDYLCYRTVDLVYVCRPCTKHLEGFKNATWEPL